MAKKDDKKEEVPEVSVSSASPLPKASLPTQPVQPMMTFDRYFASTGKPGHHKAGMSKYLKTRGGPVRRTKDVWDSFFAKY